MSSLRHPMRSGPCSATTSCRISRPAITWRRPSRFRSCGSCDGKRQFALMRWGLIPAWVKDPKKFSLLVNARGESVLEKPAFRNAMRRRRCLIPADGFYDWRDGVPRRPYFVHRKNSDGPMAFAGLWETWTGRMAKNSTPLPSSPREPTPCSPPFTTACRSSYRRRPLIFGSIVPRSMEQRPPH